METELTTEHEILARPEELEKYGYVFSLQKTLILYALIIGLMLLLGRYFGLTLVPQIAVLIFACLMLPLFIRNTLRSRYNQKRFADLNTYMEQFLYSFQKNGKILATLEEVNDLFEEGELKDQIEEAIFHICDTFDEKNVERNALRIIETEYPYSGLKNIHKLALDVEKNGGTYQESVQLLLADRQMWADRNYTLLREKKHHRTRVILSILTTLGLCGLITVIGNRLNMNVSVNVLIQWITAVVLCLDLVIFYRADRKFAQDDAIRDSGSIRDILQSKNYLKRYNRNNPIQQLGARAAKRRVTRQIEKDFPKWMMQVSLLLQTENVHVAIMRSFEDAPAVIKSDLKKLIDDLGRDPVSIRPYLAFLEDYTLPEVRSAMKMLYSISEGKGGEAGMQIRELIQRNQVMGDRAAKMKNEDAMSGMFFLFLAPQLTGGLKMLADMLALFMTYLIHMGQSGVM